MNIFSYLKLPKDYDFFMVLFRLQINMGQQILNIPLLELYLLIMLAMAPSSPISKFIFSLYSFQREWIYYHTEKYDLFSICILNGFLVFWLKLVSSLVGSPFIVYAELIQYLFQELLLIKQTVHYCMTNKEDINNRNKYLMHWDKKIT